jgi:hypothetical protein
MVKPLDFVEKCDNISANINEYIKKSRKGMICFNYDDKPIDNQVLNYIQENIFEQIANYFDANIISIEDKSNEQELTIDSKMKLTSIFLYISLYHKRSDNELVYIDVMIERN